MPLFLFFLLSFFIGSFPTAYLAGKLLKNIDIREHGSGNSGATNAVRVLGKGPGRLVFAIDFLKGTLPVFLFIKLHTTGASPEIPVWVGFAAILGHVFSPFLGFRGGKGVATAGGVLCATFPYIFLSVIAVWGLVFFITKVVSISSLLALLALLSFSFLFKAPTSVFLVFLTSVLLILWTHRDNIRRLLTSRETRFK